MSQDNQIPKIHLITAQELNVITQTLGEIPSKLSFKAMEIVIQASQSALPEEMVLQLMQAPVEGEVAPAEETPAAEETAPAKTKPKTTRRGRKSTKKDTVKEDESASKSMFEEEEEEEGPAAKVSSKKSKE